MPNYAQQLHIKSCRHCHNTIVLTKACSCCSQDKVSEVQPQQEGAGSGGAVVLASGERVEYDWLVVALGAEVDARGVPGVKEHAVPFSSYEDALKVCVGGRGGLAGWCGVWAGPVWAWCRLCGVAGVVRAWCRCAALGCLGCAYGSLWRTT